LHEILGGGASKPFNPETVSLSRRLVKQLKKIESLPRRAQEKVILTLELAIKGVASKAYQTRTASRLCLDFPGITQAANDVVLVLTSIMWQGCRGSAWSPGSEAWCGVVWPLRRSVSWAATAHSLRLACVRLGLGNGTTHRAAGLVQAAASMAAVPVAANHSHSRRELAPRCARGHIAIACDAIALIPRSTVKPVPRAVSVNGCNIHSPARSTSFACSVISLSLGRTSLFARSKRPDLIVRSRANRTEAWTENRRSRLTPAPNPRMQHRLGRGETLR